VPAAAVAGIQNDPRVAYVEADQEVHIFTQEIPTGIRRTFAESNSNLSIDGVDDLRINVDVAIIDTGIDGTHEDLYVVKGVDCSGGSPLRGSCKVVSTAADGNGHGTHVAGTVGAIDNGIGVVGMAPGARLWSIKVLDNNGSGYMSWIVAGIDFVTANAAHIEVANMSLGCECSSAAMDTAISNSVAKGVVYVAAAGNSNKDASTFSPANHPDVITVSALADFDGLPGGLAAPTCRADEDDTLANFSNWGSRIDVAAPGVCILSTWPGGGYHTISGTSMAAPHVAGAAALLASKSKPTNKVQALEIRNTIKSTGNLNWSDDSGDGIQEPLLDVSDTDVFAPDTVAGSGSGGGNTEPEPEPVPPPATGISLSATGYKVQGLQKVDLTWSGATSGSVDIHRNGAKLTTTNNSGSYTDHINARGGGTYTYKVCEAGTDTCSAEVTVTF
jgi:subtilisin